MNDDPMTCPSCGVPYFEHLGMNGTCRKLQAAHSALRIISTWASYDHGSALVPRNVEKLCKKALAAK